MHILSLYRIRKSIYLVTCHLADLCLVLCPQQLSPVQGTISPEFSWINNKLMILIVCVNN